MKEIIAGQLSFFNEVEENYDETIPELSISDAISETLKPTRKIKKKGQREEELKDFPQEEVPHDVSEQKLVETFGAGNYKSMPDEIYWQLRFEPAKWIAEKHIISKRLVLGCPPKQFSLFCQKRECSTY